MCLHPSPIAQAGAAYDGGMIVHDCVVPSARPVVGRRSTPSYDIDVREFLTDTNNAVIHATLRHELRQKLARGTGPGGPRRLFGRYADMWDFFRSNDPGSFDYRVEAIRHFVSQRVRYRRDSGKGYWQFPDETLRLGTGDCEDLAFLLASMMLASGVSGYNVRVCLGTVTVHGQRSARSYDHMWVVYKNELGRWCIVEPLAPSAADSAQRGVLPTEKIEYTPSFGFNADHLWTYAAASGHSFRDRVGLRAQWTRFNPRFAGKVHKSIVLDALASLNPSLPVLTNLLNQEYIVFLNDPAKTVAEIDLPWQYDPLDHFDSGYITESWNRARTRLESCLDPANHEMVRVFSRAAHGIADFYAHTSYAHFAQRDQSGALLLAKDSQWRDAALARRPDYGNASDFAINTFRPATPWQGTDAQRVSVWDGALLSGRWRLPGDFGVPPESSTWADGIRDKRMKWRMALPHHDDIAVDDLPASGASNGLYNRARFAEQYTLRYNAAVAHIRQVFDTYGAELRKLG